MLFLCVLAALCTLGASQRTIISSLTVTNGAGDGHWFKDEFCPIGTFATGFQILVSARLLTILKEEITTSRSHLKMFVVCSLFIP